MKSVIRLLPAGTDSYSEALNSQLQHIYYYDDQHVQVVEQNQSAKLIRLDTVYNDDVPDCSHFNDFSEIFEQLLNGKDQSVIFFQTFNSVMSQSKKRLPNASPNQRVPYAVEFMFCPHNRSVVVELLNYISSHSQLSMLNMQFSTFVTTESERENKNRGEFEQPTIKKIEVKEVVHYFNQPIHPITFLDKVLPQIIKLSVSDPSVLKLTITTQNTLLVKQQSVFTISIIPKICTNYKFQLPVPSGLAEQYQEQQIRQQQQRELKSQEASRNGYSITFKDENTLAERIKAQKCQCLERRGSQQLLIKDIGVQAFNINKRHIYQKYTKQVQYCNNQCYLGVKKAILGLATNKGFIIDKNDSYLNIFRKCFSGRESLQICSFCGVNDSDVDTVQIIQTMQKMSKIYDVQGWKTVQKDKKYIQVDQDELEFLQTAAIRNSAIERDYEALKSEYSNYKELTQSQMAVLNCRKENLAVRNEVLQDEMAASKTRAIMAQKQINSLKENNLTLEQSLRGQ